ncbi:PREDICTED: cell division cycle-associated protein 2 [Apaloderma vittatum]|nr:PREDICTED: cell division cycle-associated protein 2 [Apaloderma vittatum]
MRRRSKTINAPLEVKENESRYPEEKEEASFPDLTKDQKICLEKELYPEEDVSCQFTECFFDTTKGDVVGERTLRLNTKENLLRRTPDSLGDQCYLTPNRDKAEENSDCGIPEKQRKTPVDFATVTIAEFGITEESFAKRSLGKSPASLKLRRRSTIGVRGSPENNTLIQYLAQQRSNRKTEAFTQQMSPFKRENVRSLKYKIDAFQMSFKSIQEAGGETGFSGLSQADDAGSSENKVPDTEEQHVDQQSENFLSGNSGAGLKENLRQNLTPTSRSHTKICTILSSCQGAAVTEPAAALSKGWTYDQHSPVESLEAVLIQDNLETGVSSDHFAEDVRSDVTPDLSRKRVGFVEEPSLEVFGESKPPITPLQTGNASLNNHKQSGSHLRSVLKTPVKQLMESTKEYWNDAADRGGGESPPVSSCAQIFEALQTEKAENPKKKRVTFGEVLSPEIFDETLPANTPLRKGATPVRNPELQSRSPFARSSLSEEPLSQPDFDCGDECVEPLQELVEGPVAAEDLLPIENAQAEPEKSDVIETRSSTKRKRGTGSEGTDFNVSEATSSKNAEGTRNPRQNKIQRQKNVTTTAAKKTQKTKRASFGKRRKKKVKKPLYGEREMASKKPLLSPIPEIPEVFSAASSPNSTANALLSEDVFLDDTKAGNSSKDVEQQPEVERRRGRDMSTVPSCVSPEEQDAVEAGSSSDGAVFPPSDGDLNSAAGSSHKFSNIAPDVTCGFGTSSDFQEGTETACVKEAEEKGFWMENDKLQGNLLNKAEQLTGLEFLEQQDTAVHEAAQSVRKKDSVKGNSPRRSRRRRSSACYFPPVENLEITGSDLPLSSFNVEEVLSAPQLKNDSLEPFRRQSYNNGERRVRRSMRFHKDTEAEGLAWIQVPSPPLPACKIRRRSTSVLTDSENIPHSEENLIQFSAPGKENNDSAHLADGPCKRWKRKSLGASTLQEPRAWSQARRRSVTNPVDRKDRSNQKHYEEAEIFPNNNI